MDINTHPVLPELLASIGARNVINTNEVQSLWSGYGSIVRVETDSAKFPSVIVKNIQAPSRQHHPRGWAGEVSHARKLRSYQVEANWYKHYSHSCIAQSPVPKLLYSHDDQDGQFLVMTDLDQQYPDRYSALPLSFVKVCLQWLARMHSCFMNDDATGLWPIGCYWHFDTRPDEYHAMEDGRLKRAAKGLDDLLNSCQHKTLVHGDAKVANFCFDSVTPAVAAVDFQYVGAGCGIKDVAYFIGSCLSSEECYEYESELLACYFAALGENLPTDIMSSLEAEWRTLYPVAWADFHRFLAGWMPAHTKIDDYMQEQTERALVLLAS